MTQRRPGRAEGRRERRWGARVDLVRRRPGTTAEGSMKGPRCAECRRRVPDIWLLNRHPVDAKKGLVCSTCYARLRDPVGPCSECGEAKRLRHRHPMERRKGLVCSTCYGRLTQPMAACSECGKVRRLVYNHPEGRRKGRVCTACNKRLRGRA